MFDETTFAQRHAAPEAAGDAELFALIAEWRQMRRSADEIGSEAKGRETDVCGRNPITVEAGKILFKSGQEVPFFAETEEQIAKPFGVFVEALATAIFDRGTRDKVRDVVYYEREEALLAELREHQAAREGALERAGVRALWSRFEELSNRAWELRGEIETSRPKTAAGAVALFDLYEELDDEDLLAPVAAFLREIAAREAR